MWRATLDANAVVLHVTPLLLPDCQHAIKNQVLGRRYASVDLQKSKCGGGCGTGVKAGCPLIGGLHVEVSLGKILNPKLLRMALPSVC